MHKTPPVLLWFRQDLRLGDHPALAAALATGRPVIPVFILDDAAAGSWAAGAALRWALHQALAALGQKIPLVLRRGDSLSVLTALIRETGADQIFWHRRYEPWAIAQDTAIKKTLQEEMDVTCHSLNGRLLIEPWEIKTGQGTPYKVFTPYWRAMAQRLSAEPPVSLPRPSAMHFESDLPSGDALADWGLQPVAPDWAAGFREHWSLNEEDTLENLAGFIDSKMVDYLQGRDFPGQAGTSGLSPALALGLVSPRQIWAMAAHHPAGEGFLRQIVWREFAVYLLFHFPHTATRALQEKFNAFPWRNDPEQLEAWQRGRTGYPLVDAGMRQLWQTGWMHNRVRMVVGSFLVKHLLLSWQSGAAWFWDTLIDADLANNTMGWQWIAGSGADAAPYFRIFNPVTQSEKFDGTGAYIRRFVPELARLPDKYIHAPWTAPPVILAAAGVVLGKTYPAPIVEHGFARHRALEALKEV